MKKSKEIILAAAMCSAISACNNKPQNEWTMGSDKSGRTRDTSVYHNGAWHYYRYYGAGWYILGRNNRINTSGYMPATSSEITHPSFTPRVASGGIRTGGFGSSAHMSAGE